MNENLDLTEILKDCPKGTKLYSRCLGSVEFSKITLDNYIKVIGKNGCYIKFKPNGIYEHSEENAEIDLFPSKDQRDWSKWQRPFVDGDIVATNDGKYIAIIKNNGGKYYACCHPNVNYFHIDRSGCFDRLATEEEKATLFQAIKDNGYKWNPETKTLEKLKFDLKILQPFDKVLVRQYDVSTWCVDFYSYYDKVNGYAVCTGDVHYDYCIPYNEDTKHLVGKSKDAPEFYRYWEE